MKQYDIHITKTSKPLGNKGEYQVFDNEVQNFVTLDEVKNWLSENYSKVKKIKMYRDQKDKSSVQSGWIYCFKNKDWSHDTEEWYQQDWIEVYQVERTRVLV